MAGTCIAVYVGVALARLRYPFELEWMEGAMVDHVARLLRGLPLYTPPSVEFTPFVYPPLYYLVSALASTAVGPGFVALRLVSLLASLASFVLIGALVKRETGNVQLGLVSAGCFAATFDVSGRWFDIGRSDSLLMALVLGGVYISRFGSSAAARLAAGIVFGLAIMTKQNAVVVAVPIAVYVAARERRRGLLLGVGLIVTVLVGTLALDLVYDGLFSYYAFVAPSHMAQRVVRERWVTFWTEDLAGRLTVACGFAVFYLLWTFVRRRRDGLFFPTLALGMCASSWFPRLQYGGVENTLMPAYALVSILLGLGLHASAEVSRGVAPGSRRWLDLLAWALCAVQFASLAYNPAAAIPTAADLAAGQKLMERLARAGGPVFVASHGYFADRLGQPPTAHLMAFGDALLAAGPARRLQLERDANDMFKARRFAAVVLDRRDDLFWPMIQGSYVCSAPVFSGPRELLPVSGWRIRPEYFCVPRR